MVPGPCGVAVRDRLKHLTAEDENVLRLVGDHLGGLACLDLKMRCAAGLEHDTEQWAERKRALTQASSSRWAGSVTKATHDQWALARRSQPAHIQSLQAGVRTIARRLSLPVGEAGSKRAPGGYRSKREWFAETRRLHVFTDRLQAARADWAAGRVHVVRGGKRLHLAIAIEDLDFTAETTREKHGCRTKFRNLISGVPTSRLRARLMSMSADLGITVIAVDPAYTSKWGAQYWQKPLTTHNRTTTGHDAAAVAIGRRALGHPIRLGHLTGP